MRTRWRTVEHVFGTLKSWMGATHFRTRQLRNVATEMSLQVLAYNLKRVLAVLGTGPLLTALRACEHAAPRAPSPLRTDTPKRVLTQSRWEAVLTRTLGGGHSPLRSSRHEDELTQSVKAVDGWLASR